MSTYANPKTLPPVSVKPMKTSTNVEDESRAERRVKKDKRMDRPPGGFVDSFFTCCAPCAFLCFLCLNCCTLPKNPSGDDSDVEEDATDPENENSKENDEEKSQNKSTEKAVSD